MGYKIFMFKNRKYQRYFILYTAFSFLLSILSYLYLDKPVTRFFHRYEGSDLEAFFDFITESGEGFYWIVPTGLMYLFYRYFPLYLLPFSDWFKRNRLTDMRNAGFIALSALASGIAVNLLKLVFARYRPVEYFQNDNFGFNWFDYGYRMASFPSGHSATAMSVAFALVLLFPRYKLLIMPIGVLIVFSRVVVIEHYLSDVIMGGFVGVITTLYLYQRYFNKDFSQ